MTAAPENDRLYDLLPAVYRVRDWHDGTLRALLRVMTDELALIEADIDRLYDNWFVETCDEWVLPYIGDLLKVRGVLPVRSGSFSQRGYVANTVGYRRRKGTAAMLEQLARDLSGWAAKVVEFFELLATTQHVNHVRLGKGGMVDLHDANQLELTGGPFESAAHTAEVRHADSGRGRYNIPNVGILLWRLEDYRLDRASARDATTVDTTLDPTLAGHTYTFNPLGIDAPLFNTPQSERRIDQLATEDNVPAPLRRRPLYDELEALRRSLTSTGSAPRGVYFDDANEPGRTPVIQVFVDGSEVPLRAREVRVCNLREWNLPEATTYMMPNGQSFSIRVAVDPVLGRLAFPASLKPGSVEVSYAYGFSGDIGGGPYDRSRAPAAPDDPERDDPDTITDPGALGTVVELPSPGISTLQEAVDAAAANRKAVIRISTDLTYTGDVSCAHPADWIVIQADNGRWPVVLGDMLIPTGGPSRVSLNGLVVAGTVEIGADIDRVDVSHSTLVPGPTLRAAGTPIPPRRTSVTVDPANTRLRLILERSITGPLHLPPDMESVQARDSIIDAIAGSGVAAIAASDNGLQPGPPTTLERVTVFGPVHVTELALASNSIFTDLVLADRRQEGCVRFSYLPTGSRTPRRFRCQPDLAVQQALEAARKANPSLNTAAHQPLEDEVRSRVAPVFSSVRYGEPAYGQLTQLCAEEIRGRAEDDGEMGAFNLLQQWQRIRNLRASLNEYLRLGLEAGIFLVT